MILLLNKLTIAFIHTVFGISVFLNAVFFIPQAVNLFKQKNSQNMSLFMFLGFNIMQLFTALHGYLVKDYLLMIGFLLSFFTCGIVTFLIIFYRIKKSNERKYQQRPAPASCNQ